ncbi:hypothetical protein WJX72_001723 [[Myrmecia] bisecta]|uniref:Potassium channel domain-containing protein n=1 Tax=[Myrmecia] bisecta TaxID=41462 RepID=A0AAW1PN07_9CHLO
MQSQEGSDGNNNASTSGTSTPITAQLARRSAKTFNRISTRVKRQVAFLKPDGAEQFTEHITRNVSLSREDWERYSEKPPTKGPIQIEDVLYRASMTRHKHRVERYPSQKSRQRSIFNLPILSPLSTFVQVWGALILVLDMTYTAFIVPISVAFQSSDLADSWAGCTNLVTGAFYAVELALGFHIGFVGTHALTRRLIMDGKAVAWYYMRHGTFVVDCITVLAWLGQVGCVLAEASPHVTLHDAAAVFQVFRIMRMIRFVSVMKRLFTTIGRSSTILPDWLIPLSTAYFAHIMYGGAVLLNFFACLWCFVAFQEDLDNTWLNYYRPFLYEMDQDRGLGMVTQAELRNMGGAKLWLAGMYFTSVTISTIGFGDVVCATMAELAVCIIVVVIGVCFFGVFLGSIAELLENSSREGQRSGLFREKIATARRWMDKKRLAPRLRQIITAYYGEVWVRQNEVEQESRVFFEMPFPIRAQVAWDQNRPMFQQLGVFQELPENLQAIVASMMVPVEVGPGMGLAKSCEPATCLWLLHEGSVAAVWDYAKEVVLTAPALIGTPSMLDAESNGCWPCDYRSMDGCTLWKMEYADLAPLIALRTDVTRSLTQRLQDWEAKFMHAAAYARINPALLASGGFGGALHESAGANDLQDISVHSGRQAGDEPEDISVHSGRNGGEATRAATQNRFDRDRVSISQAETLTIAASAAPGADGVSVPVGVAVPEMGLGELQRQLHFAVLELQQVKATLAGSRSGSRPGSASSLSSFWASPGNLRADSAPILNNQRPSPPFSTSRLAGHSEYDSDGPSEPNFDATSGRDVDGQGESDANGAGGCEPGRRNGGGLDAQSEHNMDMDRINGHESNGRSARDVDQGRDRDLESGPMLAGGQGGQLREQDQDEDRSSIV